MTRTFVLASVALLLATFGLALAPSSAASSCIVYYHSFCVVSGGSPCVVLVTDPLNPDYAVGAPCVYPADVCTATLWEPSGGYGIGCVKLGKPDCSIGVKVTDPQSYVCVGPL